MRRVVLRDISIVAGVVVVNAAVALSDRMARLWNDTADSLNVSTAPVAEAVASTGITTSTGDWAVHSVLWGVSGALAAFTIRRMRRLMPALVVFAVTGGVLELLQNSVTSERSGQGMDEIGNLFGLAVGVVVGLLARRLQALTRAPRT